MNGFIVIFWYLSITITGSLSPFNIDGSSPFQYPIYDLRQFQASNLKVNLNTSPEKTPANPSPKSTRSPLADKSSKSDNEVDSGRNNKFLFRESTARKLPIYGYVENILLGPMELKLKAKLDSGAKVSSLGVVDMVEFERDGKKWIRFSLINPATGEKVEFEKKIEGYSKIKQHQGQSQRRPVILMDAKLGNNHVQRKFNLVKRKNFIYKVLLGRNFLDGLGLIDVSKTFQARTSSSDLKE